MIQRLERRMRKKKKNRNEENGEKEKVSGTSLFFQTFSLLHFTSWNECASSGLAEVTTALWGAVRTLFLFVLSEGTQKPKSKEDALEQSKIKSEDRQETWSHCKHVKTIHFHISISSSFSSFLSILLSSLHFILFAFLLSSLSLHFLSLFAIAVALQQQSQLTAVACGISLIGHAQEETNPMHYILRNRNVLGRVTWRTSFSMWTCVFTLDHFQQPASYHFSLSLLYFSWKLCFFISFITLLMYSHIAKLL